MSNDQETNNTEASPELSQETSPPNEVKEYSEVEQKAIEMGWDPNHEGKTFVPAEEYVNRAPLFERIEKQNKELKELKNVTKQMADHMSSVRKESYESALRDIEDRKLQAVSTGDMVQYQKAESEATVVKTKMAADPITNQVRERPESDPDIVGWVQKNSTWYNGESKEDKKMKAAAEAIDTFLANQARIEQDTPVNEFPTLNIKDHLKAVEKEVERLFPHRFKNMNREQPAAVGKSTVGNINKTNVGLASRLTDEQKNLAEAFNRSNPKYTPEHYAADLDKMGRLAK